MKRPFRAKSVADCLSHAEGDLKTLLDKANCLKSLSHSIEGYLPQELKAHCQVGTIIDNVLTLYADSPAWLNRLRYYSVELLTQLRANEFPSLISIEIKVRPNRD